jgi:hypothetical protein
LVDRRATRSASDTQKSTNYSVLDGDEVVYITSVNAPRVVTPGFDPGTRLPAHTSTAGRVLLAAQSDENLHAYLERVTLIAYTHQTDKQQLLREMLQIREQGFAVTEGQYETGLRGFPADQNAPWPPGRRAVGVDVDLRIPPGDVRPGRARRLAGARACGRRLHQGRHPVGVVEILARADDERKMNQQPQIQQSPQETPMEKNPLEPAPLPPSLRANRVAVGSPLYNDMVEFMYEKPRFQRRLPYGGVVRLYAAAGRSRVGPGRVPSSHLPAQADPGL